jgi:hypothetical protein
LPPYERLEGSIDDQKCPLVRIAAPGFSDPLVAFIDTGRDTRVSPTSDSGYERRWRNTLRYCARRATAPRLLKLT